MGNEDAFYAGNSDLWRLFNTLIILGKKKGKMGKMGKMGKSIN